MSGLLEEGRWGGWERWIKTAIEKLLGMMDM